MTYRVVVSVDAERDFRSIVSFLRSHSRAGADAWIKAYQSAIVRLKANADHCECADGYEQFEVEIRQSFFRTRRGNTYRLLFTISDDEVYLFRVRAPGQADLTEEDL